MSKKISRRAQALESHWSLLNLIRDNWGWIMVGATLLSGAVAAATAWLNSYGPVAWWFAGLTGAALAVWTLVGIVSLKKALGRSGIEADDVPPFAEPDAAQGGIPPTLSAELDGISASIAELRKRIDGVGSLAGEAAKNVGDVLGLRIKQMNERLDGIERDAAGLPRKIDSLMERNRERLDGALDGINQAFRAILNREWHQRLFRELGEDFDALAEPVRQGTGIPDNAKWKQSVESWWGKLDQWLVIADYYAANAASNIKAKKKDIYEGDWPFDESVLNSNQINRYKETAICWLNAKEEKPRIDKCLENSAFTLPANKWRPDSPPTID